MATYKPLTTSGGELSLLPTADTLDVGGGIMALDGNDVAPPANGGTPLAITADITAATSAFYGDGTDGPVVLDGTGYPFATYDGGTFTYTLTRDVMATTFELPNTFFLKPTSHRVLATTSILISGLVEANGKSAVLAAPGAAVADKSIAGSVVGGTPDGAFGVGGDGTGVANSRGGKGGSGGAGTGGPAGTPGAVVVPVATYGAIEMLPQAVLGCYIGSVGTTALRGGGSGSAGGGSGGAGAPDALGGAGGAGGGVVVLASKSITVDGTGLVSVTGGDGGDGGVPGGITTTGGGGGGGGGVILFIYNTLVGLPAGANYAHGLGGAGGNGGVSGFDGDDGLALYVSNN